MALSPQDKAYYEEKLGWKGCLYLVVTTMLLGALALPLFAYLQDSPGNQKAVWTSDLTLHIAFNGAALGMLVSAVMYAVFRVFLMQEWLPRRR